ncbi:hypothetical protein CVD28_03755 [Bacillus sp. M6-12]|uniref:hypothetical protein n=1 Tax=Bacillus sp. M6-12 TaxID=2054166 RepID=UPI000C791B51|nr:hypothetical protein [Bacillus sp. M6-12]PLS19543.1 hypothetical protein CVD28_03755 [Bacillus sp. M6-12]
MKTTLIFDESIDKRTVIIRHNKDVKITREVRKDHIEWTDGEGNLLENRNYIVIRYPKSKKVDLSKWKWSNDDRFSIGFVMNELENEMELLFYDRVTFGWRLYELEQTGLFKVQQRIIPEWKEYGDLFPFFINARGFREWTFNIIFGLIQLPFWLYRERQNKRKEVSEI